MAHYSAEFTIAGVNSVDAVLANLKAGSADRIIVREIFVGIETAPSTAPIFGLKRMNAVGTGAITTATPLVDDPADGVAAGSLETAWATTRPTVTGGAGRRGAVPLALGNGFLFDFTNRGLIVPLSAGLCIVNRLASGATLGVFGGHVIWEE